MKSKRECGIAESFMPVAHGPGLGDIRELFKISRGIIILNINFDDKSLN